jgi:hypothetical protein
VPSPSETSSDSNSTQNEDEELDYEERREVGMDDGQSNGPETDEEDEEMDVERRTNVVHGYVFSVDAYHLLVGQGLLPPQSQQRQIIYELFENRPLVSLMSSPAHDVATNAWVIKNCIWSTNGGAAAETLVPMGQGGMFYFKMLIA